MNPNGTDLTSIMEPSDLNKPATQPDKPRRRGRPKGSVNKPKTPATQPVTEPATDTPSEAVSLREFAQSILNTKEYRDGLRDRAKTGRLSPAESRWLIEAGQTPAEKKREGWQGLIAVATEEELVLLADLMRRAIAAGIIEEFNGPAKKKKVKLLRKEKYPSVGEAIAGNIVAGMTLPAVTVAEQQGAQAAILLTGGEVAKARQVLTNQVLSTPVMVLSPELGA